MLKPNKYIDSGQQRKRFASGWLRPKLLELEISDARAFNSIDSSIWFYERVPTAWERQMWSYDYLDTQLDVSSIGTASTELQMGVKRKYRRRKRYICKYFFLLWITPVKFFHPSALCRHGLISFPWISKFKAGTSGIFDIDDFGIVLIHNKQHERTERHYCGHYAFWKGFRCKRIVEQEWELRQG